MANQNDVVISAKKVIEDFLALLSTHGDEGIRPFAREVISKLKSYLFTPPETWKESDLNQIFTTAMMFRSVYDFSVLNDMVSNKDWEKEQKNIESVWRQFCDCRDRFNFIRGHFRGHWIDRVDNLLEQLENFYQTYFGPGWYMSSMIIFSSSICSICAKDLRLCEHMMGHLYSGKLCFGKPKDPRLDSASLVRNPRDPRCRVWPWQVKEPGESCDVLLMSLFRIDDFMEKDDWR